MDRVYPRGFSPKKKISDFNEVRNLRRIEGTLLSLIIIIIVNYYSDDCPQEQQVNKHQRQK